MAGRSHARDQGDKASKASYKTDWSVPYRQAPAARIQSSDEVLVIPGSGLWLVRRLRTRLLFLYLEWPLLLRPSGTNEEEIPAVVRECIGEGVGTSSTRAVKARQGSASSLLLLHQNIKNSKIKL